MSEPKPIRGFPDYAIDPDGNVWRITAPLKSGRGQLPPRQWRPVSTFPDCPWDHPAPAKKHGRAVMLCKPGSKRGLKRSVGKLIREAFGRDAERAWLHNDDRQPPPESSESAEA